MECPSFREAVSARLDGEPLGMPAEALDAHLAACPACAAWAEDAALVTYRVRLAAPQAPDLTERVLAALPAAGPVRSPRVDQLLRVLLFVAGVAQAGLAWPALASGSVAMSAPVHMTHETGAWNLAVAAAFLAVAGSPRLAAGALPFLGTLVALLTAVTVGDLADGMVDAGRAVAHLLLLVGLALVSVVAWRGRRRAAPAVRRDQVTA